MAKKINAPESVVSLANDYPTMLDLANAVCAGGDALLKRVVNAFADASGIPAKFLKAQRDKKKLVAIRLIVPSRIGLTLCATDKPSAWCVSYTRSGYTRTSYTSTSRGTAPTSLTLIKAGVGYHNEMTGAIRKSAAEARKVIEIYEELTK